VAFLTTCVKQPDNDDWGKLKRVLKYLLSTQYLRLTLSAESLSNIIWYVDASHQLHDDCKGHTGSILTFGHGATTSLSTKQKLPSKSSCESELIGLFNKVSDILWTRHFLEAQGYTIKTNIVYQDNMSTLSLAKNGYISSSKQNKHIKAKYFFIKHYHHAGNIDLQYCPTKQMWADVLTKPLQGAKFRLMRSFLMNCPIDYTNPPESLPSSKPRLTKTQLPPSTSKHTPSFIPLDVPTDAPMKNRSLWPTSSPRGCVETKSHGTGVPVPSPVPFKRNVTWRDTLFPPPLAPLPLTNGACTTPKSTSSETS
jgi:hypothetical protein